MINTTDFRASRRSASGSGSSGRSSRRLTEQELEIVRLREENRERDEQLRAQTEQLRAQSEYYASVHAQQQQMIRKPIALLLFIHCFTHPMRTTNMLGQ